MSSLEDKNLKKRSFAMFITMFLVVALGIFSLSIMENNIFSSNLNKLKYLHLQANVHFDYIKKFIENNTIEDIENFSLLDNRFDTTIVKKVENNTTIFYISIKTKDDTPIRLSDKIVKN